MSEPRPIMLTEIIIHLQKMLDERGDVPLVLERFVDYDSVDIAYHGSWNIADIFEYRENIESFCYLPEVKIIPKGVVV